jgi:hypothetical protein
LLKTKGKLQFDRPVTGLSTPLFSVFSRSNPSSPGLIVKDLSPATYYQSPGTGNSPGEIYLTYTGILARIKSEIGQRSWTQQANGDYPAQNFAIGPCPAVAIQSCSGILPLKDLFRIPNAS